MSTEKRLFLFLVLTFMVLAGYTALVEMFGPKRPVPPGKQAAQKDPQTDNKKAEADKAAADAKGEDLEKPTDEQGKDDKAKDDQGKDDKGKDDQGKDDQGKDDKGKDDKAPEKEGPGVAAVQPAATHPHQITSVGTYVPGNGQSPLLLTLNSRGAALERVELVGRKKNGELIYRDLDNTSGYFGNLSLTPVEGNGAQLQVVPAGTPAARAIPTKSAIPAGLQVGDVITQLNDRPIYVPADIEDELLKLKPNASIKLKVERKSGDQTQKLEFDVKLEVQPFQLVRPEPLHKGEVKLHPSSLLISLRDASNEKIAFLDKLRDVDWETKVIAEPSPTVEFRYAIPAAAAKDFGVPGPVEVVKRYRIGTNGANPVDDSSTVMLPYHVEFEVEIRNLGTQPQSLAYRLDGLNGLPTEGWWYLSKLHPEWFTSAGARDVVLRTEAIDTKLLGPTTLLSYMKKNEKTPKIALFSEGEQAPNRTVRYIGIDHQYFNAVMLPVGAEPNGPNSAKFARAEAFVWGDITKIPKGWERTANSTFQLWSEPVNLEADQAFTQKFKIFLGPKDPALLSIYGLQNTIYYGWSIFGVVARFLALILHFFYAIIGNYGIAIVLLTVLVRSLMFPVSRQAARNAAMMQELAPEMKKIAEKHKNNLEARGKAQQELFRQHNYNPLSGCWLMFAQLPVFIGLYRLLAVDIELRQAPLIPGIEWCSNLAGPDKLFYWKSDFFAYFTDESGWLGPYFNLLPLFTIALFLIHQKLFTPPATDEQTEMQMKMMKFMTIFMGILFYKVPAGLCLYFITSSLWGIAERKLLPKPTPKKRDGGDGGGSKFAQLFGPRKPPPDENGNARKKELERKLRKNK